MVTNMLSRWVKMFFLMGTMEVRKSLRRMKNEDGTGRGKKHKKEDEDEAARRYYPVGRNDFKS